MRESNDDYEDLEEHVAKHLLLEQFAIPGTLYISVDKMFFFKQKFGHHIKVEIAFDYNVDGIKNSQRHSVESPGHEADEGVTDPVDSPGHEVDEGVIDPVDSPDHEADKSVTDPVDSPGPEVDEGYEVDKGLNNPVISPRDEDTVIYSSMLSMKFENVSYGSINSINSGGSVVKERENFQRKGRKRTHNCNEKKRSSYKPPTSKTRGRPKKQLEVKLVPQQTNMSKEIETVKIELNEDNSSADFQNDDSDGKSSLVMEEDYVERKGKRAYDSSEDKIMSIAVASVPLTRYSLRDTNSRSKHGENEKDNSDTDVTDPCKFVSCPYCNNSFKSQREFICHRKLNTKKQFPCPKCHRVFEFQAFVMAHLISHHQEETVEMMSDNSGLVNSDRKPAKCDICGTMYSSLDCLKDHLMAHTSEYSHQCCICKKEVTSIRTYHYHMREHCQPGPIQCKICKIRVKSRRELLEHQLIHPSLHCGLCGQVFFNRTERSIHYELVHKNDDRFLNCPQCNKLYSSREELESHLKYHKYKRNNQCTICGGFFTCLKRHMSRVHASEQNVNERAESKFACDQCPKQFNSIISLNNHYRGHSSAKKGIKCPECSKQFRFNGGLRSHYLSVHSPEKPYVCKICGKACSLKGNLKIHMQVHKADKPTKVVQCTHCGESFTQKKSLQEHVDQKHCFEETTSVLQFPPHYFQMN